MQPLLIGFVFVSICTNLVRSEIQKTPETFMGLRLIILDGNVHPTLEFICVKELGSNSFFQTSSDIHPIEQISEFNWDYNFSDNSKLSYLSTVPSTSISEWLIGKSIEQVETNLLLKPFVFEESYRIEAFLKNQQELQLMELNTYNNELSDLNLSYEKLPQPSYQEIGINNIKKKNAEEGFAKYALYLVLGGGVFIIYSALAPFGLIDKGEAKTKKIQLARRKRWLEKIFEKGWIDRPTYHFLLKRIETLPKWLGGINSIYQSEEPPDGAETSVAFNNRKSGESVVKIKDTSFDKTSR